MTAPPAVATPDTGDAQQNTLLCIGANRLVDVGDGDVEFGAQHDLARVLLHGLDQVQAHDGAAVALLHVVKMRARGTARRGICQVSNLLEGLMLLYIHIVIMRARTTARGTAQMRTQC